MNYTSIDIQLEAHEVDTVEQIIATLQEIDPNFTVEDCLKWLFAHGCNDFIMVMLDMGQGRCPDEAQPA